MKEMEVDKKETHTQDHSTDESQKIPLENFWWILLNGYGFYCTSSAFAHMIAGWMVKKFDIEDSTVYAVAAAMTIPYETCVLFIYIRYRGLPSRLIGRHGRAALDIMALVAAIMLRIYFPYDGSNFKISAICLLASLTLQLHCWAKCFHVAWDVGIRDVPLHAIMQFGTYISGGMIHIFLLILFCIIICYRYFSYSASATPESIKKDLVSLAC